MDTIMGFYQPLFVLNVEHTYFSDGLWKGLDFAPSPATQKVMNGAGMLLRHTRNGIGVFYDAGKSHALRLYAEDTGGLLCFSFKVKSKDRAFANYTAPSIHKKDAILCFNNSETKNAEESGKIGLSKEDFASDKDFAEIDTLVAEGFLGEGDRRVQPDFVVNIYTEFGRTDDFSAKSYSIRFNARQSFWKYHLLGNMNRSNPFIVDLDSQVEFEFCGDVMLQGDKPAKIFRSKQLIPVLERSNYRFQLREPGPGAGKVLIKRLPVASEGRLGMEVINGKSEVVSESFINY